MNVCVLMSTYNGEKYIRKQLDSILTQDADCDIKIQVRDDCSKDCTISILKEYSADNNIVIENENGINLGPARSFYWLINNALDADYYAFCDQDDLWVQGKLSKAIESIKEFDSEPVLWISNYNNIDPEDKIIESNMLESPVDDQYRALFYNNVPGCCMIFNRQLLERMQHLKLDNLRMHDILALNICLLTGKVIFEKEPYLLYRQHDNNAIGYYSKKISPVKWIKDKTKILRKGESYFISEYAQSMLDDMKEYLSEDNQREYALIANYKHGLNRMKLLRKPYTKAKFSRNSLSIRLRIFLGVI